MKIHVFIEIKKRLTILPFSECCPPAPMIDYVGKFHLLPNHGSDDHKTETNYVARKKF